MPKATDIRVVDASTDTNRVAYRTPMKFGGRVVTDAVLLNVTVEVETRDGRRGNGRGSMPMGVVWAWPSSLSAGEVPLSSMIDLGRALAKEVVAQRLVGHPLEVTHDLSACYGKLAEEVIRSKGQSIAMPKLAQLVAASPLEAAIHDAYGKTFTRNSYDLLGSEFVNADLSHYLDDGFTGEFLDQYTLRAPRVKMPLYHLVGALDPLTKGDVAVPVGDELPETLGEWIVAEGLTHLKIKLSGDDLKWDVARVAAIEEVAVEAQSARGCNTWSYSADFNERCPNVEYVLDFLREVERLSPQAYRRIQYLEQPTHRDLRAHPENRMHEAARLKPVVIDESLVDYESLLLAREMGYSGVALKACKGHTEALLMAAAAQKFGMFLCVQDLTCPGASFLHSASLAARIPTVTAIEGNARQYCPAGNEGWADSFPSMFHIANGTVGTGVLAGPGLGF